MGVVNNFTHGIGIISCPCTSWTMPDSLSVLRSLKEPFQHLLVVMYTKTGQMDRNLRSNIVWFFLFRPDISLNSKAIFLRACSLTLQSLQELYHLVLLSEQVWESSSRDLWSHQTVRPLDIDLFDLQCSYIETANYRHCRSLVWRIVFEQILLPAKWREAIYLSPVLIAPDVSVGAFIHGRQMPWRTPSFLSISTPVHVLGEGNRVG